MDLPLESRTIVALSGGKASAYVADYAVRNYQNVILYFNDTLWEHKDLYRFLDDLSKYLNTEILRDSDGRDVAQVCRDNKMLANNRVPFCSRILKAERLQSFAQHGDSILFGIGPEEKHRADRILGVYQRLFVKTGKAVRVGFPLIKNNVSSADVDEWLRSTGIKEPEMYRLGFTHNNCSGGCVRQGLKQWMHLLDTLPDVYEERAALEREMSAKLGKRVTFAKNVSLDELRERVKSKSKIDLTDDVEVTDCIGICQSLA